MTRERFIKKWLGNKNFQYCEEHKEMIREDLDSVINYHQQQVKSVDSDKPPKMLDAYWEFSKELLTPSEMNECEKWIENNPDKI